jgi:hypothetical protein
LDPRFVGSNPVKGDGFLRAVKICSTPAFGGEVRQEAPCRKILQHVKNCKHKQKYFARPQSHSLCPFLFDLQELLVKEARCYLLSASAKGFNFPYFENIITFSKTHMMVKICVTVQEPV